MPPAGANSADPDQLDAFVRAVEPADRDALAACVGLVELVERWNGLPSDHGGRLDVASVAAVADALDELAFLDLWVGRVAAAFRDADRICASTGCPQVLTAGALQLAGAGPPGLAASVDAGVYDHLFEVVRDGGDGRARVLRLAFDGFPEGMSDLEWQLVVEELGLTGATPLHLVIHGWGAQTQGAVGAGEATADLYDQQGVEGATVLVVDWDAEQGTDASWWELPGDFGSAEASARRTGDELAALFTALAATDPDAQVAVTAHSLGNHVASRALTQMRDPSSRFDVSLLMVQPAIPRLAPVDDTDRYGALLGPRVRDLTVTINADDGALFWYEVQGPSALGDEAADGPGLGALVERRRAAGLGTGVVDHDSDAGDGHLGVGPSSSQGLVRSLTQELIDRLTTGGPSPQTEVREWLYRHRGDVADEVVASRELGEHLDAQQQAGRPPSLAEVQRIAERLHPIPVTPTGTTTPPLPPPGSAPTVPGPPALVPSPSPGPAPTPPTGTTVPGGGG